MRVFHGLFLLSIFLLGFCPKISAQPPSIKIGIGYFKGIDKKAFYAPVIIQNTQYQSVAISEGEPIIEINGKNLKVYENLLDDETAFLRTRAEWHQVLSACEDCAFRTVDVSNLSKKSWIGYKNIFSFGEEFTQRLHPRPERSVPRRTLDADRSSRLAGGWA